MRPPEILTSEVSKKVITSVPGEGMIVSLQNELSAAGIQYCRWENQLEVTVHSTNAQAWKGIIQKYNLSILQSQS